MCTYIEEAIQTNARIPSATPPRTVIIDSGRSRVKVLHNEDRLDFPAVVAPGREFSMPVRNTDPLGAIHLDIQSLPNPGDFPSGQYFIGDLAVAQARASATQDRARDKSNETNLVLIVAAASLVANTGPIRLVTNLPARDWARQRASLAAALRGAYRVKHLRGFLAGLNHTLEVEQVVILPEGAAAFFGAVWGVLNGRLALRNESLSSGTCRVVDIGDTTVNVVTMRDQDYIDAECITLDLGLHRAHAELLTWAQSEYAGLEITLPELEAVLRSTPAVLRYGASMIDLTAKRDEVYASLAARIASDMQARLPGVTNHVLLAGGGAVALADHLRHVFAGRSEVVFDPGEAQWLNALGMDIMMRQADADAV